MGLLSQFRDRALGRGSAASTIPVFDGPLRPNQLLQDADVVARFDRAEDLASDGHRLYVADGRSVVTVGPRGELDLLLSSDRDITALTCVGGGVAVALEGREVAVFGGRFAGRRHGADGEVRPHSINALVARGHQVIASDGSSSRGCAEWRHDLMELGHSGRVLAFDLEDGASSTLASGLGHAFGIGVVGGAVVVSESWRHRLVSVTGSDRGRPIIDHLPAYPSRIAPASDGGHWLTMFCARTQLVEFVLRESAYRREMISSVDPDLWIAPQLQSWRSFHEPLQYAALKQLGVVKPWAPPRSYGLVVKLDERGRPVGSLHSRFGGAFHGIVAAAELNGMLYLLSKGDNVLIRVDAARLTSRTVQ